MSPDVFKWTNSVDVDSRMVDENLWGSMGHVAMLGVQQVIPVDAATAILGHLLKLQDEHAAGKWTWLKDQDDVQMTVERKLIDALGMEIGGRMHTCRSRNDQARVQICQCLGSVDSDRFCSQRFLWTRNCTRARRFWSCEKKWSLALKCFSKRPRVRTSSRPLWLHFALPHNSLLHLSLRVFFDCYNAGHEEDVMVSYTHVQHAQPVSVAFWLSHYASTLLRDLDRLKAAYDITDQNVLGSGAIAGVSVFLFLFLVALHSRSHVESNSLILSGTSFNIDRALTTKLLGFQKVAEHALDATSAQDFMMELLNANAILQTHFSRLAEELILWSSWEFRTITLDDGFAMGSSMMPQKKNPGPLELMRGRAARVIGYSSAGMIMTKGLPSG